MSWHCQHACGIDGKASGLGKSKLRKLMSRSHSISIEVGSSFSARLPGSVTRREPYVANVSCPIPSLSLWLGCPCSSSPHAPIQRARGTLEGIPGSDSRQVTARYTLRAQERATWSRQSRASAIVLPPVKVLGFSGDIPDLQTVCVSPTILGTFHGAKLPVIWKQ